MPITLLMDTKKTKRSSHKKPFWKKPVVLILIAGGVFMLLSLVFFVFQTITHTDQISGRVLSYTQNEIVIVDAQERETTLFLNKSTRFRNGRPGDGSIEEGVFIHSVGEHISPTMFLSRGVRIIRKP